MAKILIADDTRFMRRLLLSTLNRGGHEAVAYENGEDALEAARKEAADLFILDVVMPKRDGLSTLQALKADTTTADTPAIMLTSRGHRFSAQEAEACGASAFFTKPFSPSSLLQKVQQLTQP
jgi:CheY-like chemotaxis protein